ncbi:MAG: GTPase HflX, partial [Actinomycetia bacterium]|nr:GTPase HflX [Actinomycetes bacterium]
MNYTNNRSEKALIVSVIHTSDPGYFKEKSLQEITELAVTAGADIIDSKIIKINRFNPKYLIGTGQLEKIKKHESMESINMIIFDTELKPAQIRNLEEYFKKKILGRTEIILDIFARRAKTKEAQLQVELAQMTYMLPRLKGLGQALSNQGGGIGTRGPGEKMLETDKRHVIRLIRSLKKKVNKIKSHRKTLRKSRKDKFTAVLVGYTNAGKSTLLNKMSKSDVFTEDRLFATLDPVSRAVHLDEKNFFLLSDTVGFIQKLPHNLIAAFRATLEELEDADLIIHVIDINSPYSKNKIESV